MNSLDLNSFNALFSEYRSRFVRFATSYVKDPAIAEDFTLEAFVTFWENRNSMQGECNAPAYILSVIKHKCLNYLEHMRVRKNADERIQRQFEWELNIKIDTLKACDPEELFAEETQRIVSETLEMLPERTREIFILSRYQNKSHKEIADNFQITTKGVEFHISKALKLLRDNLKDYLPGIILFYL